ncbi:MAG: uracil-DNA glycosylase [Anaerolineae bacterium]|nr:uracil-DNA glycosylase [Anaerolineae bacterium]
MEQLRFAQGCALCADLVSNRHVIVHGYGSPHARVLFVGEAPGYKGGDITGVPFTRDRSGVRMQQALIDLGLSAESDPRGERPRLHCFITNIVRCNPPANRTPSQAEIDRCLPYLWQELAHVQPEIVVPIGNVAARALFPRLVGEPAQPITAIHATVWRGDGAIVIPLRHPARISNADMARFVNVLRALLHS